MMDCCKIKFWWSGLDYGSCHAIIFSYKLAFIHFSSSFNLPFIKFDILF